jgi:hypothetical protein
VTNKYLSALASYWLLTVFVSGFCVSLGCSATCSSVEQLGSARGGDAARVRGYTAANMMAIQTERDNMTAAGLVGGSCFGRGETAS